MDEINKLNKRIYKRAQALSKKETSRLWKNQAEDSFQLAMLTIAQIGKQIKKKEEKEEILSQLYQQLGTAIVLMMFDITGE